MMKFIRSVPMATCGLALAFAALGNLLYVHGAPIRYVCGILSAFVLIVFALKILLDAPHARAELKTPVPLSVLPTSTMTLMLLCTYIRPFAGDLAVYLWYLTVMGHLLIMFLFFKRFILNFKIGTVYPSWFIPFVGLVVVSVTAPAMDAVHIGQAAFFAGFILYFAALSLVIYKMTRPIFVPEPLRLTAAIFTAPMSLCIVGYFSSFHEQNAAFVYFMLTAAVASYIYVTFKMLTSFLKTKFYPTYAAFTFPYVISAIAFRLGDSFLAEHGYGFLEPLTVVSGWIAVLIVMYVSLRYIQFFQYVLKF